MTTTGNTKQGSRKKTKEKYTNTKRYKIRTVPFKVRTSVVMRCADTISWPMRQHSFFN